ncbi:DinB family protein [Pedobacter sp. MW01-1-1]|uniref:DinB family protein n=1 Tax=Pedobacter sp. MW01-1-1 TaxID=3383027 RepID=UPI003FEE1435
MSLADLFLTEIRLTEKRKAMNLIQLLVTELANEAVTTRKMLALVPTDKFDWAPHTKSMKMKNLASHIAELPAWITMVLATDELDFSKVPYQPADVKDTSAILDLFEKSFAEGQTALQNATDADLQKMWTLRNGEVIFFTKSKYESIRDAFSQTSHHRAQLGVYLRLLDIPIPGSYGPSADDTLGF